MIECFKIVTHRIFVNGKFIVGFWQYMDPMGDASATLCSKKERLLLKYVVCRFRVKDRLEKES